jgi:hypothetical protein
MSNNKLLNIGDELKKRYSKELNLFTYMCPDDRKYIEIGKLIKYINIYDLKKKIKTGIIVSISLDKLILKSVNSTTVWGIKLTEHHLFYKLYKDDLMDVIHGILEKNEKNNNNL